jgi:hypothetical protein
MLRFVVLAAVLLGVAYVPNAHAACLPLLTWNGHPYQGWGPVPVQAGARVHGRARQPACGDLVADGKFVPGKDHYLPVNAIRGIDPNVAIVGEGNVYVSRSTFPALPSHPLHKQLWHSYLAEKVSGPRCTVTGRAAIDPVYGFSVKSGRTTAQIVVTPQTDVALQRHGTGYVPAGATVRVVGSACQKQRSELIVKARSVAQADA